MIVGVHSPIYMREELAHNNKEQVYSTAVQMYTPKIMGLR